MIDSSGNTAVHQSRSGCDYRAFPASLPALPFEYAPGFLQKVSAAVIHSHRKKERKKKGAEFEQPAAAD